MSAGIYVLLGDDLFLQLEALRQLMGELSGGSGGGGGGGISGGGMQRIDFDGEEAEAAEVLDEVRSFAMFGPAKVVVVRDAEAFISRHRDVMESFLQNPSVAGALVLRMETLNKTQKTTKLIMQVGKVIDCARPKDLAKWLVSRAASAHKLFLAPDAAAILADRLGPDLGRMDMELAKLAVASTTGKIAAEDIRQQTAFAREQEMHAMTGELARGRVREALLRWKQLLITDPGAEFKAPTWLGMWLTDVDMALNEPGLFRAKASWRYRGDMMDDFMKVAQSLGDVGLEKLLALLTDTDKRLKSGLGEPDQLIERFIVQAGAKSM